MRYIYYFIFILVFSDLAFCDGPSGLFCDILEYSEELKGESEIDSRKYISIRDKIIMSINISGEGKFGVSKNKLSFFCSFSKAEDKFRIVLREGNNIVGNFEVNDFVKKSNKNDKVVSDKNKKYILLVAYR